MTEKKNKIFPNSSQIIEICLLLAEFFKGDDVKIAFWLSTKNPMLGQVSPIDMLKRGRSHKVLALIKGCKEESWSAEKK